MTVLAGPRARVAAEIFDRHPDYRAAIVYAAGLENGPSGGASLALLEAAERGAGVRLSGRPPSEHPHVAAWRAAYAAFGAKPSRFPCSAEALLRRAVKDGLPRISRLVDLYNAVSVAHVLPVGGEDRDHLVGDVVLRTAAGHEEFETREDGSPVAVRVDPGEVVWCDDRGVTCRRWNWRQCLRTALGDEVAAAYFVFDALGPMSDADLDAAIEAFLDGLRTVCPGSATEVAVLRGPA